MEADIADDLALAEFLYERGRAAGRVPRYDAIREEFLDRGWSEDRFARAFQRFRENMGAKLAEGADQN